MLDISIPEPGEAEGRETGDAAAGAEWLNKMAGAILNDGTIDGPLIFEGETRVDSPQGDMSICVIQTILFQTESLYLEFQTLMVIVNMQIDTGEDILKMA